MCYANHQQKIEDFIKALAASGNPNDGTTQRYLASEIGLSFNELTSSDIEYIEREVAYRCS